jgi:excisionase family DNA binding protein
METFDYEAALLRRIVDGLDGIFDTLQRLEDLLQVRDPQSIDHAEPRSGPLLLPLAEAVNFLGLSERTLRHLVYQRRIPITKIGRRIYFQTEELARWIDHQTETSVSRRDEAEPSDGFRPIPSSKLLEKRREQGWCPGSGTSPERPSQYRGRGVCSACASDTPLKRDGTLRKHH